MIFPVVFVALFTSTFGQCPSDFKCPENSTALAACPLSFDDCVCTKGYRCPQDSEPLNELEVCPTSFNDCECSYGYAKYQSDCYCMYSCPKNSEEKKNVECPLDFDDCECDKKDDFVKKNGKCECRFECPKNSQSVLGKNKCPQNLDDCACKGGYELVNNKCEKVNECKDDFKCPANSRKRSGRKCYDNFDDCVCDAGYFPNKGRCEAEEIKDCKDRTKYKCPKNSNPDRNVRCPESADDCKCEKGYYMKKGQCVQDEDADNKDKSPTPKPTREPTKEKKTNSPTKEEKEKPTKEPTKKEDKEDKPTKSPTKKGKDDECRWDDKCGKDEKQRAFVCAGGCQVEKKKCCSSQKGQAGEEAREVTEQLSEFEDPSDMFDFIPTEEWYESTMSTKPAAENTYAYIAAAGGSAVVLLGAALVVRVHRNNKVANIQQQVIPAL